MSWLGKVLSPFDPRAPEGRRRLLIFLGGFVILVGIGVGLILVWDYTNSPAFCGTRCHTMPPEWVAYNNSYHARVSCVDCHIGRVGTLKAIQLKSTHGGHLTSLIFNSYERPIYVKSLRPARETCERCHWPDAVFDDSVRRIVHYEADEHNTQRTTFLIFKTGGGTERFGTGRGIHWHIINKVYYIATDDLKQNIPWVQVVDEAGNTTEYMDVESPLTPEQIASAEKRLMDCVDCHNRSVHDFKSPDSMLDRAIELGRISKSIPFIKQKGMELLDAPYSSFDQAIQAIGQLPAFYQANYPDFYAKNADAVQQAAAVVKEIFQDTYFPDLSVGWTTHPNNIGHKDFPGCFRCHNGKHMNAQGESIRLHCNICHTIPVVSGEGVQPKIAELGNLLLSAQEPASHLAANFMADHRFQADKSCEACHGPIQFGTDDTSFCSNSACHGTKWPVVNLDAGFTHPIPLEGKHAQVWCHECHSGVKKPQYVCANCHRPPAGHFAGDCAQCHTPAGFKESAAGLLSNAKAVPHAIVGREQCLTCHASAVKPVPASHAGRTDETCTLCHKPGVVKESESEAKAIPHAIVGREQCLTCHASAVKPVPVSHAGRTDDTCTLCHKPRSS